MASNVFGIPITDSTLEGMPEYAGKKITQKDRAHVALNLKNSGDKDTNARKYVENLKAQSGDGVATECLLYNATGDTVTFMLNYNWHGNIGQAPYPVKIANGQWGAFLHVKTSWVPTGSAGAVVYRGKIGEYGSKVLNRDWMLAWSNPWDRVFYNNTAYTEVREGDHYKIDHWDYIFGKLEASGTEHSDTWEGCRSSATTGVGTTVIFEGIMTLENA